MRRKLPTLEPEAAGDRGLDEYVNFGKYRGYTVRTLLRDNRYVHWIISYPQGLEAALRSHGSDLWWHAFITALSPQQRHLLDLTRRKGATDRLQEAHSTCSVPKLNTATLMARNRRHVRRSKTSRTTPNFGKWSVDGPRCSDPGVRRRRKGEV